MKNWSVKIKTFKSKRLDLPLKFHSPLKLGQIAKEFLEFRSVVYQTSVILILRSEERRVGKECQ